MNKLFKNKKKFRSKEKSKKSVIIFDKRISDPNKQGAPGNGESLPYKDRNHRKIIKFLIKLVYLVYLIISTIIHVIKLTNINGLTFKSIVWIILSVGISFTIGWFFSSSNYWISHHVKNSHSVIHYIMIYIIAIAIFIFMMSIL